jgi:hypothetical protein
MKKREITSNVNVSAKMLTIDVLGKEPIIVKLETLSEEILIHAALHGLKQKIADAAALGQEYTLTEKYAAMVEVFERITGDDGQWNKGTIGGAGGSTGLLFRALCRLYPEKAPEVLRAYHDKLDRSQQAALRKASKVAAIIEEIKSESVNTTGIDAGSLLGELDEL